ncbi:ABC-type cobalamin/Fe3+-siderophores transport system ATPase subunit [Clostridium saccharobutylicum]|nr:ABC-type cobalamin/Fe3+-siderophores transport system ATPase subunit [Clostridium saccharobutylicum]
MIKLQNISFTYKNKTALDNVNVQIEEGEAIAIIGPNGSGKSTFLKVLNAIVFFKQWQVYI